MASAFRVFVAAPLPARALERLRGGGAQVTVGDPERGLADAALTASPGVYEGLIVLLTQPVTPELLATATALRVVATVSVGVDHIDLGACGGRRVVVTNTPGVLTEATADLAFGLLLAAARRIAEGDRLTRRGQFRGWSPTLLVGKRVFGGTLGIVGLGAIGKAMARRARGFGMPVLYAQRHALSPEVERALGARFVTLDELFVQSDFVSLHCPLTEETRGVVSAARLASMKPGSVLVNTARGACVDEGALADALGRGPLAAAGLDVYEREPRIHPRLLALENVVLAPHIGSADASTREAMAMMAVDNVLAVMRGAAPPNVVG